MTGVFAQANLLFAPFRGLRYAEPGSLAQRVAPPYDVISPDQRRAISRQDPNNIVNIDLPLGAPGEDPYRAAADLLNSWQRRGILARDKEASAYLLRTTTRTGFLPEAVREKLARWHAEASIEKLAALLDAQARS